MRNPYKQYQTQPEPSLTRADTLLALYDAAIQAVEGARVALTNNEKARARPLLERARLCVSGLAGGVDPSYGEVPQNFLRLYEYVLHQLDRQTAPDLQAALEVLHTLNDSLMQIRDEANVMERGGAIPALDAERQFQACA